MNYTLAMTQGDKDKLCAIRNSVDARMPLATALRIAFRDLRVIEKKPALLKYTVSLDDIMYERLVKVSRRTKKTKKEILIEAIRRYKI